MLDIVTKKEFDIKVGEEEFKMTFKYPTVKQATEFSVKIYTGQDFLMKEVLDILDELFIKFDKKFIVNIDGKEKEIKKLKELVDLSYNPTIAEILTPPTKWFVNEIIKGEAEKKSE